MVLFVKDRALKSMKRSELLEILLMQSRKIDALNREVQQLQQELQETQQQLACRQIDLVEAGSIAEAALRLNGVFEAAQNACDQYVESVKERAGKQRLVYPRPRPVVKKRRNDVELARILQKYIAPYVKK